MFKSIYIPLRQDEANDHHRQDQDASENQGLYPQVPSASSKIRRALTWSYILVAALLVFNGILFITKDWRRQVGIQPPKDFSITPEIPTLYKPFWWNTEYSTPDQTLQDELWNNITWEHGLIAMDREWAKAQNWPDTISLPGDDSKSLFLLEAYHELHCLGVLRRIMKQSFSGVDFSESSSTQAHVAHCFDYLLQVVMCNADSHPLYTFGSTRVGHGQQHKCRDWNALRDYATENSACFSIQSKSFEENFGFCHNGDGLINTTEIKEGS